jgi:D-glycero-D-manno-heptose 1,7-bisphosphate phosphatase
MTAIFLDRDGVINRKAPVGGYIPKWDDIQFLPEVFASVSALCRVGFKVIVVTNQRGVALGKIRLVDLKDIHARMKARFAHHGAVLADIYFCPHDISEHCLCRKPKPGMLLRAAQDHALDLSTCWLIGDAASDIEAGKSVGCRTVRISPSGSTRRNEPKPDMRAPDLWSAARKILRSMRSPAEVLGS